MSYSRSSRKRTYRAITPDTQTPSSEENSFDTFMTDDSTFPFYLRDDSSRVNAEETVEEDGSNEQEERVEEQSSSSSASENTQTELEKFKALIAQEEYTDAMKLISDPSVKAHVIKMGAHYLKLFRKKAPLANELIEMSEVRKQIILPEHSKNLQVFINGAYPGSIELLFDYIIKESPEWLKTQGASDIVNIIINKLMTKPSTVLAPLLAKILKKNPNILLNVADDSDKDFPPPQNNYKKFLKKYFDKKGNLIESKSNDQSNCTKFYLNVGSQRLDALKDDEKMSESTASATLIKTTETNEIYFGGYRAGDAWRWNRVDGCRVYFTDELKTEKTPHGSISAIGYTRGDCYVVVLDASSNSAKTAKLFYISLDKRVTSVDFRFNEAGASYKNFVKGLDLQNKKAGMMIHLSEKDIDTYITANTGHAPASVGLFSHIKFSGNCQLANAIELDGNDPAQRKKSDKKIAEEKCERKAEIVERIYRYTLPMHYPISSTPDKLRMIVNRDESHRKKTLGKEIKKIKPVLKSYEENMKRLYLMVLLLHVEKAKGSFLKDSSYDLMPIIMRMLNIKITREEIVKKSNDKKIVKMLQKLSLSEVKHEKKSSSSLQKTSKAPTLFAKQAQPRDVIDGLLSSYYSFSSKESVKSLAGQLEKSTGHFGFKCKDVPRDGLCLIHSIIDQLELRSSGYPDDLDIPTIDELKESLLAHILENLHTYNALRTGIQSGTLVNQALSYQQNWSATIGDIAPLALARALNINVVIISSDQNAEPVIIKRRDAKATVYLGHEGTSHYQSLERHIRGMRPPKDINYLMAKAPFDDWVCVQQQSRAVVKR